MFKSKKILSLCAGLLLAMLAPGLLQAQSTLTVADGTATSGYVPIYGYYMDAAQTTQMLYPDSMLTAMRGNSISSMKFYSATTSQSYSSTMTMKLAVVSDTTIGSSLLTPSSQTTVWTGQIVIANGELNLSFDDEFLYPSTGGNLLVELSQTSGGNWASSSFYGISATSMSYMEYTYNSYDGGIIPKATFSYGPASSCIRPNNLRVTSISNDSVYLAWTERGSATQWDLIISDSLITDFDNATTITATDTLFAEGGLSGNTLYYVYLRANCGSETSSWTSPISFRSACLGLTSLPYTTSFENDTDGEMPACWTRYAEGTSGAGTFPSVYNYSYNANTGNIYFEMESSTGETEIAALPTVANNDVMMQLEFWAGYWSYSGAPMLEIGYMDDSTFMPLDTVTNLPYYDYGYYLFYLEAPTTTDAVYAFRTTRSSSYTLFIDDLTLSVAPNCLPVADVVTSNPTTSSIDVNFTTQGDATSWNLVYDTVPITNFDSYTPQNFSSLPYTLNGLDSNTTYYIYVQSDCGSETSEWVEGMGTTFICDGGCEVVVNLASTDSYGYYYATITLEQAGATLATLNPGSGFTSRSYNVMVCPTDTISLMYNSSYYYYDSYNTITVSDIYTNVIATSSTLSDSTVIRFATDCQAPSCPIPQNFAFAGSGSDFLSVSWTEMGEATAWNVAYGYAPMDSTYSTTDMTVMNITDTTFATASNLIDTVYYFYVQSDCGDDNSDWVGPISQRPNTYVLAANANTSTTMCGGHIYDDGGVDGVYSNNQSSTLVINPVDTLHGISITGTLWSENSSWDYLKIYAGEGTNGTELFSSYGQSNSISSGMAVTAFNDGPVTIYFQSDGSVNGPGFDLAVSCYELGCNAVSDLQVVSATSDSIVISWVGDDNAQQYKVKYSTQNFSFASDPVDSLYVTDTVAVLSGLTPNTVYYIGVATDCGTSVSNAQYINQRTECADIATIPYTNGFESDETYNDPFCFVKPIGGTYPYVYNYSAHNGSKSLYFYTSTYSSTENIIALPAMEGLDTLQMKFFAYTYASSMPDTFQVGVLEADSTFVPISNVTIPTSYDSITVYFAGYTGTGNRMAFRMTSSNYAYTYIDDITVSRAPNCLPVTNVTASSDSTATVELSWDNNGSSAWQIVYDTTPITDFTNYTPLTATTNPFTVGGLTPATNYYFYVRSNCGTEQSEWTMGTGSTLVCDDGCTVEIVMTDSYGDGWNGNAIEVYQSNVLITTATITSGSSNTVMVNVCPNSPITFSWVSGSYANECSFSINDPFDELIYSASNCSSLSGTFATYTTTCQPPTCTRPSDLMVAQAGVTSVTLSWTGNASNYEVNYYGADGNDTSLYTNTNSITITGLDTLAAYNWMVRGICSATDTSTWSLVSNFSTTICDNAVIATTTNSGTHSTSNSFPANSCYNYSYTQTIIDSAEMAAVGGAEITAFQFEVEDEDGAGQALDSCMIYMTNDSNSVFDGAFLTVDSTWTLVYNGSLNISGNGWHTFMFDTTFVWDEHSNVVVAIARYDGDYICSVVFATTSCNGAKTVYEYDDYDTPDVTNPPSYPSTANYRANMNFIACGAGCGMPNVSVSSFDYQSATIVWSGNSDQYEVAVKAVSETTWPAETTVSNANTYTFNNLLPATQYTARVRQICDSSAISDWGMVTFVTDSLPCFAPSNVEADAQGQQAVISWTAGGNETEWTIHVFNTTFDQEYTTTANPYTVTGLTANVTYNVAVSANCGGGLVQSDWSDTISFTTVPCDPVTNVAASNVMGTTATITWTAGENNTNSWEVSWNYQGAGMTNLLGTATVSAATYDITGLTANTPYEVFVRAICAEGYNSDYATTTFTTQNVGIAHVEDGLNLSIFPNPATGNTTITLSGVNGYVTLSVVDMSGRTVQSTTMECSGDCEKSINVDNLAVGAYFVRVYGDNVNTVKKLIVK